MKPYRVWSAWLAGIVWISGVLLRWFANVYLWHWRTLLPVSAALELAAFLMFFRAVSQHKAQDSGKSKLETWVFVVIAGTAGLLATLLFNLGACIWLSSSTSSPALPQNARPALLGAGNVGIYGAVHGVQRKVASDLSGRASTRSTLAPMDCGRVRDGHTIGAAAMFRIASALILALSLPAVYALRILAKPERAAKTTGIHASFPFFVRLAYIWLTVAASLEVWAANATHPSSIWGASRHALIRRLRLNDGAHHRPARFTGVLGNAASVQR
jgi:hypothetical protein